MLTSQQEADLRQRWKDKDFEFVRAQVDYDDVFSGYYGTPHRDQAYALERGMLMNPDIIFDDEPMRE